MPEGGAQRVTVMPPYGGVPVNGRINYRYGRTHRRRVFFDHLITIIYAVTFIIAGLNRHSIGMGLWALIIAFVLAFALEGIGLFGSRILLQGGN